MVARRDTHPFAARMRPVAARLLFAVLAVALPVTSAIVAPARAEAPASPAPPLRVGVTLHPYDSWTRNVVRGTDVEVVPILPGDVDAGDYQVRPQDVEKIAALDAIVVNGLGHDAFVDGMIEASGNRRLRVVRVNEATPLLPGAHGETANSHTFLSFSNAIAQSRAIADALGGMRPALAAKFRENAAAYAKRLRTIKNAALSRLADARVRRVVTVHDGYAYLMQELGVEIAGVVQPAHGLQPSAKELAAMVDLLRKEKVAVVFAEETFPEAMLVVLREEGHARVYVIGHVASGEYADDKFEREMQENVDVISKALVDDPPR